MKSGSNEENWKIAEFIGWRRLEKPVSIKYFWRTGSQTTGTATVTNPSGEPSLESWVPDFFGDLNAMRLAEKSLNIDQEYLYGEALAAECRREENSFFGDHGEADWSLNGWGHYALATLDAGSRARVFLRLFGDGLTCP